MGRSRIPLSYILFIKNKHMKTVQPQAHTFPQTRTCRNRPFFTVSLKKYQKYSLSPAPRNIHLKQIPHQKHLLSIRIPHHHMLRRKIPKNHTRKPLLLKPLHHRKIIPLPRIKIQNLIHIRRTKTHHRLLRINPRSRRTSPSKMHRRILPRRKLPHMMPHMLHRSNSSYLRQHRHKPCNKRRLPRIRMTDNIDNPHTYNIAP